MWKEKFTLRIDAHPEDGFQTVEVSQDGDYWVICGLDIDDLRLPNDDNVLGQIMDVCQAIIDHEDNPLNFSLGIEKQEIPRTAKITKSPGGKVKLEYFGRPELPDDLRKLNWGLSELGFIETYPIGCRRFFAESEENLTAAVDLLESFGFEIEFFEDVEF